MYNPWGGGGSVDKTWLGNRSLLTGSELTRSAAAAVTSQPPSTPHPQPPTPILTQNKQTNKQKTNYKTNKQTKRQVHGPKGFQSAVALTTMHMNKLKIMQFYAYLKEGETQCDESSSLVGKGRIKWGNKSMEHSAATHL